MALACIVPMVLILLLPAFGLSSKYAWIAIIAMIIAHLLLMKQHRH
jgi:hypothetical protein